MTIETTNFDLFAPMKEKIKRETTNKLNEMLMSNTPFANEAYKLTLNKYIVVITVDELYDAYKREQHV